MDNKFPIFSKGVWEQLIINSHIILSEVSNVSYLLTGSVEDLEFSSKPSPTENCAVSVKLTVVTDDKLSTT